MRRDSHERHGEDYGDITSCERSLQVFLVVGAFRIVHLRHREYIREHIPQELPHSVDRRPNILPTCLARLSLAPGSSASSWRDFSVLSGSTSELYP